MRVVSAFLIAMVAACGSSDDAGDDDGGDGSIPAELTGIVEAHNAARADVGVPALTWDPALAKIAQAWANKCVDDDAPTGLIDHNDGRSEGYPTYVGENVYGTSGTPSGVDAVESWVEEKSAYDPATGDCIGGEVCGHYTQVVWRTTTKVGCGVHVCSGLRFSGTVVCDYGPGGNSGGKAF